MPAPADAPPGPPLTEVGAARALFLAVRRRILSGLLAALPIALTVWIVLWMYDTLMRIVLGPAVALVRGYFELRGYREKVVMDVAAPVVAVVLLLAILYCLGLFVRSRVHRALDWVFLHVPVVNTIFKALNNVFQSLADQFLGKQGFNRVVLVSFPHPGLRSLGFVTNSLADATTGRTILCVSVLTGVMPPSGFTLFVPEEDVTDIDWSVNQTLQAILSGGITAPATVHYVQGVKVPPAGPIVDPKGHPIAAVSPLDGPPPPSGG